MNLSKTHIELVEKVYATLEDNIAKLRSRKSDSLTLAEKILYGHARNVNEVSMNRGCLLYTSPSPRDAQLSRMPSSA